MPRNTRKQLVENDGYDESYQAELRAEVSAALEQELHHTWQQDHVNNTKTGRRKANENEPRATPRKTG